ncbi:hypothetical protein [Mucilaginibacter segetis]|uniref:Uncharacterized protein n=1 Tax=Mucilaginibacter segetis TaxID=2793071 RepID=A0A934PRJ7_9SPHI|nr:hypothetical protein [Mucilaginibacter segetis]MBK0378316.1 hypothetical protein [Mucilaginibacter segetis]
MDNPDESFLEEYKPLHVPHTYDKHASVQENVVYALAQLQYATAHQVALKLAVYEPETDLNSHEENAAKTLTDLFSKGLIKGSDDKSNREYNLSKILTPNSGKADELF